MQWLSIRSLALRAFLGLVLGTLTHGSVQAALLAYDGFDYPVGQELSGKNGGTGFSGAWQSYVGSASIESGSLNGAGLTTSGGKVFFDPTSENLNIFRTLQSPLTPASGVSYISFLADLQSGQRFLGMSLYDGTSEIRLIGKGGGPTINTWGIYGSSVAPTTVPATTESLFVLRIDWAAGTTAETLRLWVYPSSGSLPVSEPAVGTANSSLSVQIAQITQLRIGAGSTAGSDIEGNGWMDEIRVGTTWNDVVPVPEPSSFVILGFVMLGGLGFWQLWRNE